ncbi:EI24 domain-containing protein [Nitratiruptor sp. SB155-2]|uniref:EI24 domain-containing protein n=1 Tax=Nitratiruptor sp. (strain SB155-2) TaxID=387092 RepID=UPI00015871D2|nr:EI24 domain-containing protein [Nitratiruptor sp. SB155-2]BAF70352.1 hypothetical protein NIS_1243 [Nitratiruptor sp. SB155-2]
MQKSVFVAGWEDFMTKKFLAITFVPFFLTLLLFTAIFYGGGQEILHMLEQLAQSPNAINDPSLALFAKEHPILAWLASNSVTHFIIATLLTVLGVLFAILLSTATATIIMGFFTPYIIKEIHKRHYSHLDIGKGLGIIEYMVLMAKIIVKSIGLFLLSFILYFIPLLNAIALNIPFYYLFHSFLSLDVGGEIMSKEELENIVKKYRFKIMGTTGVLYLITLIPMAGMILQVYFVSVMAHLFFRLK